MRCWRSLDRARGRGRGVVAVTYRIDPDTVPRLRAALVAPEEQLRLRAYQERLAALTRAARARPRSVAKLLPPLFALAAERSAAGGDAAAENRAALLTLTFYANQRPLGMLVPAAYLWPRPRPWCVTLRQRQDFALHFLVSAVIAAEEARRWPMRSGCGRNWPMLAAAAAASASTTWPPTARARASANWPWATRRGCSSASPPGVSDADLLPQVGDLPEHLPEAEFVARFGGVGAAPVGATNAAAGGDFSS